MTKYRTHYFNHFTDHKARCGNPLAKNGTIDPTKVTCGTCKRLMKGVVK